MKEIVRKCTVCDKTGCKTVKLDEDKFIYYNNCYYHYNCFIKRRMLKNENTLTEEEIIKIADDLVLKTKDNKTVKNSIDLDRLTYWLYENYNISSLPNLFFIKLKKINDGKYANRLSKPIFYYELLQIFIKMKTYLDKINYKNEHKDKKMTGSQRVEYDLAIVINNYDEYIKWRQKQATESIEKQEIKDDISIKNNIQTENIVEVRRSNNEDKEINIADLLDELF